MMTSFWLMPRMNTIVAALIAALLALVGSGVQAETDQSKYQILESGGDARVGDPGLRVVITGSGSAMPDPERAGASVAVIVDDTVLQFDFGRGVMENMIRAGINPLDVDHVFFTHHHFDHIGQFDYYVVASWIASRQDPVSVFGPPGTRKMYEGVLKMHGLDVLFTKFIVENWPEEVPGRPLHEPPHRVHDIEPGVILEEGNIRVSAVESPHLPAPGMRSMAYRVDSPYGSVVITGDTGYSEEIIKLSQGADILVHECQKPDAGMVSGGKFSSKAFQKPTEEKPQTKHTSPSELGEIAKRSNVGLVVPYHLSPYLSWPKAREMTEMYIGRAEPDIWERFVASIRKNFDGEIAMANDAMVIEILNE